MSQGTYSEVQELFEASRRLLEHPGRLEAVRRYAALEGVRDPAFESLTRVLQLVFKAPIALVSMLERERQWFKAHPGLDVCETSNEVSFCRFTIMSDQPLVVEDATTDPRFRNNGFVTGSPSIRFYAGVPLIDQDGWKLGSLCVIDDKTRGATPEQLEILKALAEQVVARLRLSQTVLELEKRTRELTAAREEARHHAENTQSVLANVSHEIRTPMNGLLGNAALLERSKLNEEQREWIGNLQHSGQHLLTIINDVLDHAKIRSGLLDITEEPFNPASCIREIVKALAFQFTEKGLKLDSEIEDDVPEWVIGDAARVRQILFNLLSNALKFTSRGGVRISLDAESLEGEASEQDGGWLLHFSVSDTGKGIENKTQTQLFKPFMQAEDNRSRPEGGTGLGLSICKQLAVLMGGDIKIRSRPGVGSTFLVRIRVGQADQGKAAERGRSALHRGLGEKLGAHLPLKILVVDDSSTNRRLLDHILQQFGYPVTLADCGHAAVEACQRETFDLILMDVRMPDMSGIETAREVRKIESARSEGDCVPAFIAALSADSMSRDVESCEAAGMNAYLTKPFLPADLEVFICERYEEIKDPAKRKSMVC